MFCMLNKEKVYLAFVENLIQIVKNKLVILLMISNGEGWHYLAVKKLLALLGRNTSKYHGEFIV